MNFGKFTVVSDRNVQALEETHEEMIFNLDHIVSVKPIKIPMAEKVIDGFWIRTTNGKKYRAISAPDVIKDLLHN
ncbi:hypothetical protein [Halobacteriovorax sp. JY17]|uniref:hypothetical protein n=1 Tax=Halobacteriovorax sp. JY17 TaxID=2014617 RepID=UPI000C4F0994|nr:hypothetical protein [Halobacteriovorax sp. JY17]PIK14949.1 MAG: hypothetical protein CES88_11490 [Halobacteriovorax sp. JY17]